MYWTIAKTTENWRKYSSLISFFDKLEKDIKFILLFYHNEILAGVYQILAFRLLQIAY